MKETHLIFSEYRGRVPVRVTCSLCRERFVLSSATTDVTTAENELRAKFEQHVASRHSQSVGSETASLRLRQAMADLEG